MTLARVGPAGVWVDALAPEGGAERVESFAEHAAPGSSGLDEAAEVREQEREDAVLGWLAARSLGTHGCADQLSERPADERRGDERADHRGLTGAQLVESADGLQYSEQIFDGPSQTIERADSFGSDAVRQVRREPDVAGLAVFGPRDGNSDDSEHARLVATDLKPSVHIDDTTNR